MKEPFEEVKVEERRFQLMSFPDHLNDHTVTQEQLALVDKITGERWILMNVVGRKLDWLIERHVELNNNLFHLETETIRSKKFRDYLWTRITLFVGIAVVVVELLAHVLPKYLFK